MANPKTTNYPVLSTLLTGIFLHRLVFPTSLLVITALLSIIVPHSMRVRMDDAFCHNDDCVE